MTHYGIMTDYDYTASHKRERLSIWSGPFASVYEGEALTLPKGDGYMVTTYNGDKVRVECPTPRTERNYQKVDRAISTALNAHHDARGDRTLAESAKAFREMSDDNYQDLMNGRLTVEEATR